MTRRSRRSTGGSTLPGSVTALRQFLTGTSRAEGTPSFHELQGFLFALAAVPEVVLPSEWIPLAFGGTQPEFESEAQAREVIGGLMQLYNEINADVTGGGGRLPEGCGFRDDALSNLSDDAPVSSWSRGFVRGHMWLRETWDEYVPNELEKEFGAMILALSFFSSRRIAERSLEECAKPGTTLLEMAQTMRSVFSDALSGYARLGRSIHQALLTREPRQAGKVGRNEPCPCGSGKKHKRCCRGSP